MPASLLDTTSIFFLLSYRKAIFG